MEFRLLLVFMTLGSPLGVWSSLPFSRKTFLPEDRIKRFAGRELLSDSDDSDETFEIPEATPSFDTSYPKNVTAMLGQTVYLHCVVNNLGDKIVSWIRLRDNHLLTVGLYIYTSDARFQVVHSERNNDWMLKIRYIQQNDVGLYKCQINLDTRISLTVNVNVVVPKAEILGPQPLFVETGSPINLTCVITQSREPPAFIFWYHDDRMINYDLASGEISFEKVGNDSYLSRLYIKEAQRGDSGNYTCSSSSTVAAWIEVSVLNVAYVSAVQKPMDCLREAEKLAGECVSDVISEVILIYLEDDDEDSFNEHEMICTILTKTVDCVLDRVEQSCREEIADRHQNTVAEELRGIAEACSRGDDVTDLFYSLK